LLCKDGLITSNYYRILTQAHHDQPIIDYSIKKTGWTLATFNEVDWDSHQRAFKRLTRFQRFGISKLIHNLSNTNRQNKLFYGSSDLCPGCSKEEETFEHVLRCSFPATMEVRATALDKLHKSLVAIGTPSQVVEVILKGFQDWLDPDFSPTRRSRPTTFGSLRPADILITQAYSIQFHTIGWFQFCLGRVGKSWHKAVQALLPPPQTHRRLVWGSNLVYALWQFTKSMWAHRNAIVHGIDSEEAATRILTGLRDQVHQHYQSFSVDAGYVLVRHQYLFTSRTLEQRLSMSYDYVTCWLRSVEEARAQLSTHIAAQKIVANRFFGTHPFPQETFAELSSSDSDYVALSMGDTASTSLATHSTHDTTCTYRSDESSLFDDNSCTLSAGSFLQDTFDDQSLLGSLVSQSVEEEVVSKIPRSLDMSSDEDSSLFDPIG
jgi:hypothetical protein